MSEIIHAIQKRIRHLAIEIITPEIQNFLDEVNQNLSEMKQPELTTFIIEAFTPYFNDGEECEHGANVTLAHMEYDPMGRKIWPYVYDDGLEDNDKFRFFFPEIAYTDVLSYVKGVEAGNVENILQYTNSDAARFISNKLNELDEFLQIAYKTNYTAKFKLVDGTWEFCVNPYEPPY